MTILVWVLILADVVGSEKMGVGRGGILEKVLSEKKPSVAEILHK